MNQISNYQFLGDASIRVDNITFRPWPDFTVINDDNPLKTDRIVANLLESDDPFKVLWRAKIPDGLLRKIKAFPRCLWRGLLEVSQLHPAYFTQWSRDCPALIGLMAIHESETQIERDLDRMPALHRGGKERLRLLGLPATKECYRILSKLPLEDCYPVQLNQLREAINDAARRKLMRHLSEITTETLETLQLPTEYLDVNLLNLRRSDHMPAQCESIAELCREIAHFRKVVGKLPHWPYRGAKVTNQHLVQARDMLELRLALGENCKIVRFPKAPLAGIKSAKLKIEPLDSVRALFREGKEMSNCIMTYARSILNENHYAYRMLHPVRATILLRKNPDDWYPVEIRTFENKYASADAVDLVFKWAGTIPTGKEVTNDFPF
ncbi:MAG: hypothetical protein GVY36_10045 [Verrucomicrobia bacterium]|nr:hypothetical protein [Verrucomicrobiota bacterium]